MLSGIMLRQGNKRFNPTAYRAKEKIMKVIFDPVTDSLTFVLKEGHMKESDELRV